MVSTNVHNPNDLSQPVVGRFAPSPSGRIHVGNLFSFMVAYIRAHQKGGSCVLRIEDLDPDRSKQCHIDQIFRDLDWFGFEWSGEAVYQSERTEAYQEAFDALDSMDLLYPCFCTRADLHAAQAPHPGEEFVYQGTCRHLSHDEQAEKARVRNPAYRICVTNDEIVIDDAFQGEHHYNLQGSSGDFIVRRSDKTFAYQLAVVVDDAYQQVNDVCRGIDLLSSAPRQRYLQELLGLPEVTYAHVPLFLDEEGRRLSKRNNDATLSYLIDSLGLTACQILGYIAYCSGMIDSWESVSLSELIQFASLDALTNTTSIVWKDPSSVK